MAQVSAVVRVVHDARPVSAGVHHESPNLAGRRNQTHSFERCNGGYNRIQRGFRHIRHLQNTHPSQSNRLRDPKRDSERNGVTKRIHAFLLLFRAPDRRICGTVTPRRAARARGVAASGGPPCSGCTANEEPEETRWRHRSREGFYEWGRWRASAGELFDWRDIVQSPRLYTETTVHVSCRRAVGAVGAAAELTNDVGGIM